MRTHIMLYLIALFFTACASYRDKDFARTPAEQKETQEQIQHAQMIDGQASRIH